MAGAMSMMISSYRFTPPSAVLSASALSGGASALGATALPSAPTSGNILVAVGFGYSQAPVVNTAGGWTAITGSSHNATTFDPYIRAAWRLVGPGETAAQTPFTSGGSGGYGVALWEVRGLDATWTPTFDAATPAWSASTGTAITATRSTTHNETLCLFAAFAQAASTAQGDAGLTAGWDSDGTSFSAVTRNTSTVAAHQKFPTSGTSASCTATFPTNSAGRACCMISIVPV